MWHYYSIFILFWWSQCCSPSHISNHYNLKYLKDSLRIVNIKSLAFIRQISKNLLWIRSQWEWCRNHVRWCSATASLALPSFSLQAWVYYLPHKKGSRKFHWLKDKLTKLSGSWCMHYSSHKLLKYAKGEIMNLRGAGRRVSSMGNIKWQTGSH